MYSYPQQYLLRIGDGYKAFIFVQNVQCLLLVCLQIWFHLSCIPTGSEQVSDDPDHPTFQQKFVTAMQALQNLIRIDDLGQLYDIELIPIDTHNKVQLICFCASSSTLELPFSLRSRFMWRKMDIFETENYKTYIKSIAYFHCYSYAIDIAPSDSQNIYTVLRH